MLRQVKIGLGHRPQLSNIEDLPYGLDYLPAHLSEVVDDTIATLFGDALHFSDVSIARERSVTQLLVDFKYGSWLRRTQPALMDYHYAKCRKGFYEGRDSALSTYLAIKAIQGNQILPEYEMSEDPLAILYTLRDTLTSENPAFQQIVQGLKLNGCLVLQKPDLQHDRNPMEFYPGGFDAGVQFAVQCLAIRNNAIQAGHAAEQFIKEFAEATDEIGA